MSHKSSKSNWLRSHIQDSYVKLSKLDGYRARSVYKLQEIDKSDDLFEDVVVVIDLGSAPGSWSQYAAKKLKEKKDKAALFGFPLIIAVDLLCMEPIHGVSFIQGDFCEDALTEKILNKLKGRKADLVISDMAPNLSGVAAVDSSRIAYLGELILDFSSKVLKQDGSLLVKSFYGKEYSQLVSQYKNFYQQVFVRKPRASRDKSSEIFLLGRFLK